MIAETIELVSKTYQNFFISVDDEVKFRMQEVMMCTNEWAILDDNMVIN